MKKILNILKWLLIIFLVFFVAASAIVITQGKKIVINQLQNNLKVGVRLEKIELRLPFTLVLNRLEIGDLFSCDKISFTPVLPAFLSGKIVLANVLLSNPQVNLVKSSDGSFNLPVLESKGRPPQVILTDFTLRNGKFVYMDKSISREGLTTILNQVDLSVSKIPFPLTSLNARFKFSGILEDSNEAGLGSIGAAGWVDFTRKDMDATLEAKDLNVVNFSPYYGDLISKSKILSARLNLSSLFKAKDNDLEIKTHFVLSDLVYAKETVSEAAAGEGIASGNDVTREAAIFSFSKSALDLFIDSQGKLDLEFVIQTKLDKPNISIDELKKSIFAAAGKNLLSQNPEVLKDKIENIVGDFEEFGKKMKEMFKNKE